MSYYTFTRLEPYELARAADVNERFEQIVTAFDSLPALAVFRRAVKDTVLATNPVAVSAYVFTSTDTAVASLALGQTITFKAGATNTGSATLNVDGLGAVAIKRASGDATVAGDIVSGRVYRVIYDGSAWQLTNLTIVELNTATTAAAASALVAAGHATTAGTHATTAATQAGLATTARIAAELAETNAETAETNAETAETNAVAAKVGAEVARDDALAYRNTASTHATTATTKAGEASASATTAAGHVTTAAGHVTTALGHANSAAASAITAGGHVTTAAGHVVTTTANVAAAQTAETNAETAETNAAGHAAAAAASAASINDANLVHKTGDETIAGAKTFSSAIVAAAGITINGRTLNGLTAAGEALVEAADLAAQKALLGITGGGPPTAQSTSYTILAADGGKLFDAAGLAASITYTLPAASGCAAGTHFWVRNPFFSGTAARTVSLAPNGTDTIDGVNAAMKVYCETVRVVLNAAGNGWTVEKDREVLCLEYSGAGAASTHEITVPFNDSQFCSYRIEWQLNHTAIADVGIRLGRGGSLVTANNYYYSTIRVDASGNVYSANASGATYIKMSDASFDTSRASGIVEVFNARLTGNSPDGPFILNRHTGGGAGNSMVSVTGAMGISTGELSSFALMGGGFNLSNVVMRVFGIRKGI